MINLSTIQKRLITDVDSAISFLDGIAFQDIGLDCETTGLDPLKDRISGVSIFDPNRKIAAYLAFFNAGELTPLGEHFFDSTKVTFKNSLQAVLLRCTVVMHSSNFDMSFMVKAGLYFEEIKDSNLLATMLQLPQTGLKHLVFDWQLVQFQDITQYTALISKYAVFIRQLPTESLSKDKQRVLSLLNGMGPKDEIEEVLPFSLIDLLEFPIALHYACNDSIFCLYLVQQEEIEHNHKIGSALHAEDIRRYQFDTEVLLTESSMKGYVIEPEILASFVETFREENEKESQALMTQLYTELGWLNQGLFDLVSEPTSKAAKIPRTPAVAKPKVFKVPTKIIQVAVDENGNEI